MNEIVIGCNLESPQESNSEIKVFVLNEPDENLLYKFIVGLEGAWETLKDFGDEKSVVWKPNQCGSYILMIQGKREDSTKAFDYVSRKQYNIGQATEKLIKNIYLDREKIKIGEKITARVEYKSDSLMFRYFLKEKESWTLAKDYCTSDAFIWSANSIGKNELLVQCKYLDSEKSFEDAMKLEFYVEDIESIEIIDFKCLNSEILAEEELVFEVEAKCEDNRTTLYKFVKISSDGQAKCIQDYSTKKILSYKENFSGEYKLLCLAKDMYSPKEYDDRAILHYKVIPYKPIEIENFTSDLTSPQVVSQSINLKAIVKGGKDIRYRYIIEGSNNEDSGYIRSNTFAWEPKVWGDYKINLWVKDISSKEKYDACKVIEFTVDEIPRDPVKISEIISSKNDDILTGEEIKLKVIAKGGIKLLYSFLIKKDNVIFEETSFSEETELRFEPHQSGKFQIEIRVKDKYSYKAFDTQAIASFNVYDYIPAKIDYILMEPREYYLIGDQVILSVITRDTKNTFLKYLLSINGHKVEETDYAKSQRYILTPRCSGRYSIKIYGKNEKSNKEFDAVQEINLLVKDAPPITNTILKCDKVDFYCNEPINITAESCGGKDVVYEFYLMEKEEWILVQNYSKKNYYTFIPFTNGKYKILVLAKSSYRKDSYEDYFMIEVKVGDNWIGKDKDVLKEISLTEEEIEALNS